MAAANPCATASSVGWIVASLPPRTSIRLNRAYVNSLKSEGKIKPDERTIGPAHTSTRSSIRR
jgi:hypothetical protein